MRPAWKGTFMNKAITDGIVFAPPAFSAGLDTWSSGDGTPGSDTYANAVNAALVPADQDFGGALELQKTQGVQRLRYMGETPILPGCYLRVRARIKAVSGNLPEVRIAGWAGGAGGAEVAGVTLSGGQTALTGYGEVVEVSAIVGTGNRAGVDMVWGPSALYGHFGLDLTGPNGGVVRIDDLEIEDVSDIFLRDYLSVVDVRDFGAIGDGATDDHAAFEAADAAAAGREVLVPAGRHFLGDSVTFQSRVRFEGSVTMPTDKILSLTKNFDLPAYSDAFGGDTEMAFKKAYQALLNNPDHVELDMCGRKVELRAPVDMQAAVPNRTTYGMRHVIKDGEISVVPGANFDVETVTSQATYSPDDPKRLTGVANVANILVGSLVQGNGVGRELYVRDKDVAAQTVTLSHPLHDAAGTQTYTFRRFKYMLDFTNFGRISRCLFQNIEFQCGGDCSAVILPPTGKGFMFQDCFFTRARERCITSPGEGDQGMMIDRCQFISDEGDKLATERTTIALNTNANDVKIRNCRITLFRHFAVIGGSSTIFSGNHMFQGDSANPGPRLAGIVLTRTNNRATITGNYIDNCAIEWSNEYDNAPEFESEFSFSSLSITGNIFLCSSAAPWFTFLTVKPHGPGHFLSGLAVTGNTIRVIDGELDKFEGIDTTFAGMNFERFNNIRFSDNVFHNVRHPVQNPLVMEHTEPSVQRAWTIAPGPKLPFNAWLQHVESLLPSGPIRDETGAPHYGLPYYDSKQGPDNDEVVFRWEKPVRGSVVVRLRIDDLL